MYPSLPSPGGEEGAAEASAAKVFHNPLVSHPVLPVEAAQVRTKTADQDGGLAALPSPASSIGAASSSGRGGGGGKGGDGYLRRLTQSLVDVLETMSSSVQRSGASEGGRSLGERVLMPRFPSCAT